MCESLKIKIITGQITFKTADNKITVPEVTRTKCENCGEEFFDREANKVLDQYRKGIANKRVANHS